MLRFFQLRLFVICIIACLNIIEGYSQLYINEILASNVTINNDPQYKNYGDWIEIYNAGSSSVNLEDYTLTDDINIPDKYVIENSITVSAHSYRLIWTDGYDSYLHTNFSLDSDGEWIALYDPYGNIVDSVTFKAQIPDVSFGRQPNGSSTWLYFADPTPENSNSTTGLADLIQAPDVSFSVSAGFYSSGQTVAITCSSPTATIRYTTDGSIPDENSPVYSSPEYISSTTVLKARCYESGLLPGNIGVNTYFINESTDLPVVSLSTDHYYFFDWSWGIYVVGSNGIPGCGREEPANWFQDWERPINFEYFETDGQRKVNKMVGTKLVGACSRNWPSKSLTLISREKYGERGLYYNFFSDKDNNYFKSLTLRNSGNDFGATLLRDGFMQNLLVGRMDIDYQAYQPAVVFLNGEYWGILNVREKMNEHYVESNYGINADNVSVLENNVRIVHGTADHYNNLMDFVRNNDLGIEANFEYIETQMDVNEYLHYFISNTFFDNEDWPHNNIKYWRENNSTSRWRWMLFDTDFGYGLSNYYDGQNLEHLSSTHWSYELIRGLLDNQDFENEFIQRFAAHMNTTFNPYRVIGILDSLVANIDSEMHRHLDRWPYPSDYNEWLYLVDHIRGWAHDRIPDMTSQFFDYFDLSGTYNLTTTVTVPNSGRIKLCDVDITNAPEDDYFNDVPIRLEAIPEDGYRFVEWTGDVSSTSNPLYVTFSSDASVEAVFDDTTEVDPVENVYINEFAANETWVTDDHGEQEDWIEIYNDNDFAVDIGGLFVSDDKNLPMKFRIPDDSPGSTTIPANGYLVLWADNQTDQGPLHVNFKLDMDGEEICLVQRQGTSNIFIDSLTFSDQYINTTFGRYPDGENSWSYLIPTPGSSNIVSSGPVSGIVINEFSTDNDIIIADENGEYDDWIELYNTTDEPIDVGGLFMTDSLGDLTNHRIPSTDPDSTTIPAYGHLLLWADNQEEQGVLHLGFKLGRSGEQIALVSYNGTDIIDSLTYGDQYANSSASRYPDGEDTWINPPPTPGSTNTLPVISGLYVNEFSASNTNIIADENGEYDDWIEIYNSTDNPIDIGGLFITDNLSRPMKDRIPSTDPDSTTVPPHGYLLLWADNQEDQGIQHLDFSLSRGGEQIGLVSYNGTDFIDSLTYDEQYSNSSSSRYPDGNNSWVYTLPTPGSTNILPAITGLYINEFSASNTNIKTDEHGEYDDWIEIYNSTGSPVDIGGLFITDSLDDPMKYRIPLSSPGLTTIPAYGYLMLWADNQTAQGALHLDFGLSRNGDQIGLAGYDGVSYIDSLTYDEQFSNSSSSRYPDGNDSWIYPPATPGSTNTLPVVTGLYINEFSASNSDIIDDENGENDDWIEIYNSTDYDVDIGGMFITDNLDNPFKHRISDLYPDSTTIPPDGYIVLWADNQNEQGVLHLNFSLGRSGEQIGLPGYNGTDYVDSITYSIQDQNSASCRYPDAANNWIYSQPTPGNTNIQPVVSGLYINEFSASNTDIIADPQGEYDDWIEIYNSTSQPVNIGGMFMTDSLDDPAKHRIPVISPDSTTIPAYGYMVLWADDDESDGVLHLGFNLRRTGEQIGLVAFNGTVFIDSLSYGDQNQNSSLSRYPDAYDIWISSYSTPGSSNSLPVIVSYSIEGSTDLEFTLEEMPGHSGYNAYRDTVAYFTPDKAGGTNRVASSFADEDPVAYGVQWTDNNVIGNAGRNYFYIFTAIGGAESANSPTVGEFDYKLTTTPTTDFNEIALALDIDGLTSAQDLMTAIPSCNSVARWDADMQGYEQYVPAVPPTNFAVQAGYPYYVNVIVNTVFTMLGEIAEPQFDLVTTPTTDFNDLMLTLDNTDITKASELMADIPNCNSIARWNAGYQGYEQYIPGIPPTDFNVRAGYPYYVNVTSDILWPESPGGGLKSTAGGKKYEQQEMKNSAPHVVYGKITTDGIPFNENNIIFSAYLISHPEEKLGKHSAGCMIKDGYWIVQCNTFSEGWTSGDTLKIVFKEINGTLTGQVEAELTSEPADDAGTVIFEEGTINNGFTQISPNPFNFETILQYQTEKNGRVIIDVYNVAGQRIRSLVNEDKEAGVYEVRWNGRDNTGKRVPDGVYIYIMRSGDFITRMKTVFIK